MKKISKITLQDKVVLGDIEMRHIMGGYGDEEVAIDCKFNANHSNCADTTSRCRETGGTGVLGHCVFQIMTNTDVNYSATCYCPRG